jgi:predicted Zn-dependent protease with MMP-like domain
MTGEVDPPDDVFEALIEAALEGLPQMFRERLGSVAIVVEDEPSAAQLASVGARGLFGLYVGVPRTAWGVDNAAVASKIVIFSGPLIRAHGTGARLGAAVEDVVHHEIAHHFGISDARLRELKARAARDRRPP